MPRTAEEKIILVTIGFIFITCTNVASFSSDQFSHVCFQVKVLAETRNRKHTKQLFRKIVECYDIVTFEDVAADEDDELAEVANTRQSECSAVSEPGAGKIRGGYTGKYRKEKRATAHILTEKIMLPKSNDGLHNFFKKNLKNVPVRKIIFPQ